MARQSRIRKSFEPAKLKPKSAPASSLGVMPTKSNLMLHFPDSDKRPSVAQTDPFWKRWGWENKKLIRRYPLLGAKRNSLGDRAGEWIIHGPAEGIRLYRELAIEAAQHIGCKEGPEGCVQYWLAHTNGEHIIQATLPQTNFDEVDLLTENSDGSKEFHMGRQKHAGGEMFTDSFDKPKFEPMKVPSVIVPSGE